MAEWIRTQGNLIASVDFSDEGDYGVGVLAERAEDGRLIIHEFVEVMKEPPCGYGRIRNVSREEAMMMFPTPPKENEE